MSATTPNPKDFATHAISLTLNGQPRQLDVLPWTTLLDLLRDQLDLIGTKKGCDHGQCGACTVLRDGTRINACLTLAIMCDGAELTTIEGLANGEQLHPMQQASSSTTRSSAVIARRGRSARLSGLPTKAAPVPAPKFRN